jgi:hypothetical protein
MSDAIQVVMEKKLRMTMEEVAFIEANSEDDTVDTFMHLFSMYSITGFTAKDFKRVEESMTAVRRLMHGLDQINVKEVIDNDQS